MTALGQSAGVGGGVVDTTGWVRDRAVPEAFTRRLAEVFPRVEGQPWLLARWEPGDPWDRIERWTIWEVAPWSAIPLEDQALVRAAMEGPNPRSTGHYCAAGHCPCDVKKNRWTGGRHEGADYIRQWEIHRECAQRGEPGFPRMIWVVQGEAGGHPLVMDTIEQQLAQAAGLPAQYPTVGALPFAPLDERVIRGLITQDRLRDAKGQLRDRYRTGAEMAREQAERAQQAADSIFEFIMAHTAASAEEWAYWERRETGAYVAGRHGEPTPVLDRDAIKRQFIEDLAVVPVSV